MRQAEWSQLLDDCRRFLTDWGMQAVEHGWTTADLFGVGRSFKTQMQPIPQVGRVTGLALMLTGGEIQDLDERRAVVRSHGGATLTCPRRPVLGAVPLWGLVD